jgi:hypothetical protein
MKTRIYSISPSGYGHKEVTIEYRGKKYKAVTSDMSMYDAYKSEWHTLKQQAAQKRAEKQLIRMVKRANNLR